VDEFLKAVKANVEKAGVFGEVATQGDRLQCAASGSAEPAWYRLEVIDGRWHVALVTPNRWLSESIEADLMHHGDPIEELIEEELVEQGFTGGSVEVKHFRSDDMLYTFQSPIPVSLDARSQGGTAVTVATQWLLAYEAAFRRLGDMET
jgi:hypothetical protein